MGALILGISFGAFIWLIGESDLRWVVYSTIGVISLFIFLVVPNKERLLVAVFFLSLQIDVYLRFFYGMAGSREGLAIPLVAIAGVAVILWTAISAGKEGLKSFEWAGSLKIPIIALLGTTALALTTTTELFIGVSKLLQELMLCFVYFMAFNLTRSEQDLEKIVKLLFVTLGVQTIIYIIQSALDMSFTLVGEVIPQGEVARPGGTVSSNPAGFTSFIMPPLMIALALFMANRQPFRTPLLWLLVLGGCAAVGLSYTRAAWAGLMLGFTIVCLLLLRYRLLRIRRTVAIIIALAVAASILVPTMMMRVDKDYGEGDAWSERLGLIRIALDIISAHPLTGIGPGSYGYIFKSFVLHLPDQWLYTVHNEFLLRAAENGVPGAIAFALVILFGLRLAWRLSRVSALSVRLVAIGWIAGLSALIWQMSWVPWTGFSYNAMMWLMLGVMDGADRVLRTRSRTVTTGPILRRGADAYTGVRIPPKLQN
ncbi:MAG TPA: O-antigen ligase family protein [Burkholderiales bacterium]|nr:O-antigen ligase family protein [Burkholderiales bacterium]